MSSQIITLFHQPPNMLFPLITENKNAVFMELEMHREKIHSLTPEYLIEAESN